MSDFTHVLYLEDQGFLHFTFNSILFSGKKKFQVTVLTRGPQCHHFSMEQKNGRWKIVAAPKPPDRIMALEKTLGLVIDQQLDFGLGSIKNLNVA